MKKIWKKAPPRSGKSAGGSGILGAFSGIPVKVYAIHGRYLFTARLQSITEGTAELAVLHCAANVDLNLWAGHIFEAELRGYSEARRQAIRARGFARYISAGIWGLSQISFANSADERVDYRQETNFDGTVTFLDRRGITGFCHVADLSLGGVCLKMNRPTAEGERLCLRADIFKEAGIETLPCLVCYNRFDGERNLLCGCRFYDLRREDRDNLARLMIKLQLLGRA